MASKEDSSSLFEGVTTKSTEIDYNQFSLPIRQRPEETPISAYVTQVQEPNGFHSCRPTAILNGLVRQGVLSTEDAPTIHERMIADSRAHIAPIAFQGETILVYPATNSHLETFYSQEGVLVELPQVPLAKIDDPKSYIKNALTAGVSVVGGDKDHAMLATDIDENGNVCIIDPANPYEKKLKKLEEFTDWCRGDGWITLVR